jgi:hypothetical protein
MRILAALAFFAFVSAPAWADEPYRLTIRDHKFVPERLEVAARVKIKVIVKNEGKESAEFESFELNREKVVLPGGEITVFLGPLEPGEYPFFDDFHLDTKGVLVAK